MNDDIDQFAENLIRNEILCCDSALVEMLLERDIVSVDDITNLSRDIDNLEWHVWSVGSNLPGYLPDSDPMPCSSASDAMGALADMLERHAESDGDDMAEEYDAAIRAVESESGQETTIQVGGRVYWVTQDTMSTDDLRLSLCESSWWAPFDDGWRCTDGFESENDLIREPLEWWRVTTTLARDLIAIGEPVLKSDYGTWWGRTISGQAIIDDGTIQRVAQLINSRIGGAK